MYIDVSVNMKNVISEAISIRHGQWVPYTSLEKHFFFNSLHIGLTVVNYLNINK